MEFRNGNRLHEARASRGAGGHGARLVAFALVSLYCATALAQTADIEIVLFDSIVEPLATPGEPLALTVEVSNESGPDAAGEVAVTTTLPECIGPFNAVSRGCRNDPAGVPVCELGGVDADEVVEFVLDLGTAGCITGEPLTFTVVATTDSDDPIVDSNTNSLEVAFDPKPPSESDIGVTLAAAPAPASVGEPLVYRATVENRGPDTARDLLLSVSSSPALEFVSATAPDPSGVQERRGLSCTLAATLATCRLPVIAINDDIDIAVTLATRRAGTVSTRLEVRSSGDFDSTPADNEVLGEAIVRAAVVGDFDGDRCVTTADVALFSQVFRARRYDEQMDLNADGILNTFDIARLRAVFGGGDGPACR